MKTLKILSRNSLRFITLAVLSSVSFSSLTVTAQADPTVINAYKEALTDSIKTEPDEITNNLTIINNPQANSNLYWDKQGRVLVVTFTQDPSRENPKFDPLKKEVIWVTVAPKLKSFCTNYKNLNPNIQTTQLNQRIKQVLGINPESGNTHIVELWVKPDLLLHRPTVPPGLTNIKISDPDSLDLSKNNGDAFLIWLNEKLKNRKDLQNKLNIPTFEPLKESPLTGLGYTFDWASKLDPSIKEFGLSEFVIWATKKDKDKMSSSGKVAAVEVNRVFTTEEYCKPDN